MADTPTGETATPTESKTTEQTPATPEVNAGAAEVERLRKEAEQAKMRANQLQNQIDEAKKAQDATKAKELEEQNEFKSLYEQTQAKLKELETQKETEARQKELEATTQTVLGDFSQEVVEIAKEAGISATDTTEEAKVALKEKLERISSKVVASGKVTPNNPQAAPSSLTQEQLLERVRYGDKDAKTQMISGLNAVQEMKAQAGYSDK